VARVTTAPEPLEMRPAKPHISFSTHAMYHPDFEYSCGRKTGYKTRLALPETGSMAMIMGSALDEAANRYFELRIVGTEGLEAAAKGAEAGISTLQAEDRSRPELFDHPVDAYENLFMSGWASFLLEEGTSEAALVQTEHQFMMRIGDRLQPVIGYSDRVDRDGTLVDHKWSGSPRWTQDGTWHERYVGEKSQQLLLYWLARLAEEKRLGQPLDPPLSGKARLVVVHHRIGLVKPQVRVRELELDLEIGHELLMKLAETSEGIHAGRYPARPGVACRFCSFLGRCRDDERERGTPFDTLIGIPF
jgi:PD-(D/E)XK nuclease superfamily